MWAFCLSQLFDRASPYVFDEQYGESNQGRVLHVLGDR